MRNLIYIFLLLPLLGFGQTIIPTPDFLRASLQQNSGPAPLYNVSNAASPTDEANTATGFVDRGLPGTTMTVTSVSTITGGTDTSPQNGSYSILIEQGGTNDNDGECYVTVTGLENGSTYQVTVYAQEVVGLNWRIVLRTGFGWTVQDTELTGAGGWTQYTLSGTTDTTSPSIQFGTTTGGDVGDKMAIDNIVITKL